MSKRKHLMTLAILAATALCLAGCFDDQRDHQLPTAKEVFQLRSACADLGQRIVDDLPADVGSVLTQDQVSHYDPRTNRCYVEVTVQSVKFSWDGFYIRNLYDGQTKEMLASTKREKGKESGMAFGNSKIFGWVDTNAYIDAMMKDDRR